MVALSAIVGMGIILLVIVLPPKETSGQGATSFSFTAGGDFGATSGTDEALRSIASSGAEFHAALGDFSYSHLTPESAWCDYVKARVGNEFPFELITGNHEDQSSGDDGFIDNFIACLPHRLESLTGRYGKEYYFDHLGLVRFIMIAPGMYIDGQQLTYRVGDENYTFLSDAIDGARSAGIPWVIVGSHIPCYSIGVKGCSSFGVDLLNLLVSKKVDLVISGHDHNYQRTKQLAQSPACPALPRDSYDSNCVVDDGADNAYEKGKGTVFTIIGTVGGGGSIYDVSTSDSHFGYMAAYAGNSTTDLPVGYLKLTVSSTEIATQFINTKSGSTLSESFSIGGSPPLPDAVPPTVGITSPTSGASVSGTVTVSADATDDVGVVGVQFSLDGLPLGTEDSLTPYATSWDTTLTANGAHTLTAVARDAAGNRTTSSSVPVTVGNPSLPEETLTFTPTDDARIWGGSGGDDNYGSASTIEVDKDESGYQEQFLMNFNVSGVAGRQVVSATLSLYTTNSSNKGGDFHRVSDNNWSEGTVTWNTAPASDATSFATLGAVSSGQTYQVNLTPLITGDGTFSLRVKSTSTDGAGYSSKEATTANRRPSLVVTVQNPAPPTPSDTTPPAAVTDLQAR